MEPDQDLSLNKFKLLDEKDIAKNVGGSSKSLHGYFHKRMIGLVDTKSMMRTIATIVNDYKVGSSSISNSHIPDSNAHLSASTLTRLESCTTASSSLPNTPSSKSCHVHKWSKGSTNQKQEFNRGAKPA